MRIAAASAARFNSVRRVQHCNRSFCALWVNAQFTKESVALSDHRIGTIVAEQRDRVISSFLSRFSHDLAIDNRKNLKVTGSPNLPPP